MLQRVSDLPQLEGLGPSNHTLVVLLRLGQGSFLLLGLLEVFQHLLPVVLPLVAHGRYSFPRPGEDLVVYPPGPGLVVPAEKTIQGGGGTATLGGSGTFSAFTVQGAAFID
jgi:hypothetical protein